jgi:hypothetical protein
MHRLITVFGYVIMTFLAIAYHEPIINVMKTICIFITLMGIAMVFARTIFWGFTGSSN